MRTLTYGGICAGMINEVISNPETRNKQQFYQPSPSSSREHGRLILFCCKARRKRLEHERSRGKHEPQASVSPYFLSALAAS